MADVNLPHVPFPPRRAARLCELMVAGVLIILTLPLMVLIAVAIKCESAGPIISQTERVGSGGRRYLSFKFRITFEREHRHRADSNATRVGAFLRNTLMQNLPQLINVLRGQMGCICSRPEQPFFLD
jgi:lipopolysaccharide/colanic/teichoic acid biosynthesis glycosyltransferase